MKLYQSDPTFPKAPAFTKLSEIAERQQNFVGKVAGVMARKGEREAKGGMAANPDFVRGLEKAATKKGILGKFGRKALRKMEKRAYVEEKWGG